MGVAAAAEVRGLTLGTTAAVIQGQKAAGNCANLMQSLATAQTCVCWSLHITATSSAPFTFQISLSVSHEKTLDQSSKGISESLALLPLQYRGHRMEQRW